MGQGYSHHAPEGSLNIIWIFYTPKFLGELSPLVMPSSLLTCFSLLHFCILIITITTLDSRLCATQVYILIIFLVTNNYLYTSSHSCFNKSMFIVKILLTCILHFQVKNSFSIHSMKHIYSFYFNNQSYACNIYKLTFNNQLTIN